MKVFVSFQIGIIAVACCICWLISSNQSDAGFIGEKNIRIYLSLMQNLT